MKPDKVHKVQAQRKFAQGAYIPVQSVPIASTSQDAKRDKTEQKDVICNKTSAKNLLDFVAFQRNHKHEQLLVVVKRLEEINAYAPVNCAEQNVPKDSLKKNDNQDNGKLKEINNGIEKTSKLKKPVLNRPKLNMSLRSRSLAKKPVIPRSASKRKVVSEPLKSPLKKKRLSKSGKTEFTSDDSIPLCYMKAENKQEQSLGKAGLVNNKIRKEGGPKNGIASDKNNKNRSKIIKKNKGGISDQENWGKQADKIDAGNVNNAANDMDSNDDQSEFLGFTAAYQDGNTVPHNVTSETLNGDDVLNRALLKTGEQQNELASQDPLQVASQTSSINTAATSLVESFKKPTIPVAATNSINVALEPQPGPSGINNNKINGERLKCDILDGNENDPSPLSKSLMQPVVTLDASDAHKIAYYNQMKIHSWLKDTMAPPAVPSDTTITDCPAKAWVTLKDVVNASEQDLSNRCNKCLPCTRVAKLFKLSSLLKKQRTIECPDEEEEYDEPIHSGDHGDSSMVSSGKDNHHLYLELLPSHPHLMIKLKNQHVHDKQVLSARLIPRSDAKISDELLLVEHEYLVDELTNMLTLSLRSRSPSIINVRSQQPETPEDSISLPDTLIVNMLNSGSSGIGNSKIGNIKASMSNEDFPDVISIESSNDNFDEDLLNMGTSNKNGKSNFPRSVERAKSVDAPVFYPTKEEFNDPISYFEKIAPTASKFGLCKVVPPPKFTPKCKISDEIRFDSTNQYISRLYSRWGPAARELCAIKACVNSHSMQLTKAPLLDGIEINLPKLYHLVQRNGGLEKVINKKRWGRVAEDMRLTKTPNPERKLEQIYMKYLLPYDTLAHKERQEIIRKVERCWNKRNRKMLDRALNPLHRQKRLLGESDSSGEDTEDESVVSNALSEAEDCIVPGSCMNLTKFKRVASIALENSFRNPASAPTTADVEQEYWRLVLLGTEHICINTASIDTGEEGYGFSKNKQDPYYKHAWNLKMLSQNSGNVLRSLGPVLGLTVPTLHLGMVFSTSCWHRDPHGLPWIEYMHEGPSKIWYGIPDEQSRKFRTAVESLCPTSCQNKCIWLPSDITMIPPNLLLEHNVSLSRIEQKPGEYIIVFPKAYSCSISTGYTISESVYFATNSWLNSVHQVFQEVRDSCEPTMFSLEQLLMAIAQDHRTPLGVLQQVHANLSSIVTDELDFRVQLEEKGFPNVYIKHEDHVNKNRRNTGAWNIDECEVCRMTLYLSQVSGLTGKKSSICLQHTLRLLEAPTKDQHKDNVDGLQVVTYFTSEELTALIDQVQTRLTCTSR